MLWDKKLLQVTDGIALEQTVTRTSSADSPIEVSESEANAFPVRYKIDGEFARGGIGRILKARDERLDREVAVKELLSADARHRERFQREAAITARLQHPAIVPVHDAGEWPNGAPFYVMKLLSGGRTLKQAVSEARNLDGRLALLPNVIAIADAIAYAHSVGIIHRDLKPSNVLLGSFGETIVIDWGLAKELSSPSNETQFGDAPYRQSGPELTTVGAIVGTPQYMPPEQARGEAVDMRADVYALGAILYYVLSGQPPFAGISSPADVVDALLKSSPKPVDQREPAIPQDLATIVNKAMARTPGARYESASEFAEDLKRFQTGQLVGAHKYSRRALAGRWLRRNRRLSAVASVLVILLAVTAIVSVRRIVRERNIARDRSNELILGQAKSSIVSDPTSALAWLKLYKGPDSDVAASIAADAVFRGIAHRVLPNNKKVVRVVFSPDGKLLASGGDEGVVKIWDVSRGTLLQTLPFREVYALAMAPDGRTLAAAGGEEGDIRVWDLPSGRVTNLKHEQSMIADLQFLNGGMRLISLGEDSTVHLWDLPHGHGERLPPATAVSVSPDGSQFATVDLDDTVFLRSSDGRGAIRLGRHDGLARYLVWSGSGDTLVSAGDDAIEVWDVAERRARTLPAVGPLAHSTPDLHPSIALSSDGEWLAAVTRSKTLHLWNLKQGTHQSMALAGSLSSVVKFAPHGSKLAIGDVRGLIRLFDVRSGSLRELRGHTNYIQWLDFSPTQPLLASASSDNTIRIWRTNDQSEHVLGSAGAPVLESVYSPDSRMLATADAEGGVFLWNGASGDHVAMKGHHTVVRGIGFSSDGAALASASWDKSARVWRVGTNGETSTEIRMPGAAERVLFLPGDRQIVIAAGGSVWVAGVNGGASRQIGQHDPNSSIYSLRRSPVAPEIATAGADGTIHLIRLDNGSERIFRGHTGEVFTAEFSADGRLLLSSSADGTVRLWNVASGSSRIIRQQQAPVRPAVFVIDDKHVASPSEGGGIVVVDIESGRSWALRQHDQDVVRLVVSPDRKLLASAANDGTVRLWQLVSGQSALLGVPGADALSIAFSSDGQRIAIGDTQGEVRQYDVGSITFVPPGRAPDFATWLDDETNLTIGARQQSR